MLTSLVLLSPSDVRRVLESRQAEGESFTSVVNRTSEELEMTPKTLWNFIERGVSVQVKKSSLKMLQHAVQQGVAPDWLQLRSFLTTLAPTGEL